MNLPRSGRRSGDSSVSKPPETVDPGDPPTDMGSNFVRLRLARLAAGYAQQDLANAAGISRQAVAGLEAGRWNPSLQVALDLARALGMSVEELFGPGEPPPPIDVSVLSETAPLSRLDLAMVGGRAVALPLSGATTTRAGFLPAAGSLQSDGKKQQARPFGVIRATLVVAGCDPALGLLESQLLRHDPPVALSWWPCSSTEALRLAAAGLVHVAAAHLPVEDLDSAERDGTVVGFARWREGLVLHPSRAAGVDGLGAVAKRGLRLVNRDQGAEARSMLESLRGEEGVSVEDLPGYGTEARGHLEVASAVDCGLADLGPASEPAGLAYGLSFLPVAFEHCELRIADGMLDTAEVRALLRALASPALRLQIESLPGYDAAICGEVLSSP